MSGLSGVSNMEEIVNQLGWCDRPACCCTLESSCRKCVKVMLCARLRINILWLWNRRDRSTLPFLQGMVRCSLHLCLVHSKLCSIFKAILSVPPPRPDFVFTLCHVIFSVDTVNSALWELQLRRHQRFFF